MRFLLGALALLAAAWLVVSIANVHAQRQGRADLIKRTADARQHFQDAQTLNPDRFPRVLEGAGYALGGDPRRAVAILDGVVRDEPENARAWALLGQYAQKFDPARAREAFAQVNRLRPLQQR